ncbi:MAG TPA: thiolase family protein [Acidimicrobiia bacterium]|nr:thiolase family protein [Acidimicrobiia bacterium]
MPTAVIVDALRTPMGRRQGALSPWHPVDLAAHVVRALIDHVGVDPALVDDVIVGCVSQVGEQAFNIGRNVSLAAGFPDSVAGTSVDRQCGSSQQAVHFAAQGVIAGAYDLVIAAGVEHMSRVPMGESVVAAGSLPFRHGAGDPFGTALHARYPGLVPQGIAAETVAERFALSRDELDAFALESHRRAECARSAGRFASEIVAVPLVDAPALEHDETVRAAVTADSLAAFAPAFKPGGIVTAGNSAPVADGAAAVLIASEELAARLGLHARARFVGFAVAGADPVEMLTAPIPATHKLLERVGVGIEAIDRIEAHEAFASSVLAWARSLHADSTVINVNGGAIALGHPLGASGARMLVTLVHELERSRARTGVQVMSEGGGTANALLLERL